MFIRRRIWYGFYGCCIIWRSWKGRLEGGIYQRLRIGSNILRWRLTNRTRRISNSNNSNNKINKTHHLTHSNYSNSNSNSNYNNNKTSNNNSHPHSPNPYTNYLHHSNKRMNSTISKGYSQTFLIKYHLLILNYSSNFLLVGIWLILIVLRSSRIVRYSLSNAHYRLQK